MRLFRSTIQLSALLSLIGAAPLYPQSTQAPVGPAASILGTWRGSSICVDRARDTACHDEQVIYQVDSAASPQGPVRIRAAKLVNGTPQAMGAFQLQYDGTTHRWSADLSTRLRVRWSFAFLGDQLSGTLTELPSGRLIRRVTAARN